MVAEIEEAVGVPLSREADKLEEARIKLDAGLGAELLAKYKAKEQNRDPLSWQYLCDPGYETLILGAYMMHVGAKIDPEDRQHLKDILPRIPSRNGHCLPIGDDGFRDPGQVQYKAALENYVDGNTRSFFDPRQDISRSIRRTLIPAVASTVARPRTILLRLTSNFVSIVTKMARQLLTATESARKQTGKSTRPSVEDQEAMDPFKC